MPNLLNHVHQIIKSDNSIKFALTGSSSRKLKREGANFLASQMNGKILNYSKIAKDCGVDSKSIERYFEILIDTLLGFYLEPYHESVRRRQSQKSKFYFFDLGVRRALDRSLTIPIDDRNFNCGNSF